ncbi:TetR family transcriptional regulator [Nonomuraea dietziae]|uniref:TetR family transcriptional regulator n=1 Tax=Nonomuraea dietziae TaxID=65515 RepID=UPI0033E77252
MRGEEATPRRILAAAGALFATRGYRATSMNAIAERVGITKAALYYHFSAKDDLLHRLTEPLLEELERALEQAEARGDPEKVRWSAIEGYVDACLRHREALLLLVRDTTLLAQAPVGERFKAVVALAHDLVRGPDRRLEQRVRAAQAVAALGDPVVFFPDAPVTVLRELILGGAHALLDDCRGTGFPGGGDGFEDAAGRTGSPAVGTRGRSRGREGGRPPALSDEQSATARRLYGEGQAVGEIAERFGVSRATVYRVLRTSFER